MKPVVDKIINIFNQNHNIVIAGHAQPDGDAIGACFALAHALKKSNKNPIVLVEDWNDKYSVIEGREFIYTGDLDTLEFDVFVSLDTGTPSRLGFAERILNKAPLSISVDHHLGSQEFCDYNYIDAESSSTSELMYDILIRYVVLDTKIATALYAGIIYDTGAFCYSCTTKHTLHKASLLMDFNINFNEIYNEFFYMHALSEAVIFGMAVSKLKLVKDYPIAYTFVTGEEMKMANANPQDTDGIVSYVLNTRGVEVGIFVYPQSTGASKVSFRSRRIDVRKIASSFGGGGHKLASGCSIDFPIDETLNKVLEKVKKELDENE